VPRNKGISVEKSILGAQTSVSEYIPHEKEPRFLGKMTDSMSGEEKIQAWKILLGYKVMKCSKTNRAMWKSRA
jgi:hypothetical protein